VLSRATYLRRRLIAGLGLVAVALGIGLPLAIGDGAEPKAASELGLRELAGQRIVVGFEGHSVPTAVRQMVRAGDVAGVILFSDNYADRAGARRLVRGLQAIPHPAAPRDPLLLMVDQEGGSVRRLSGAPRVSASEIGRRGGAFAREQGRLTARNLRNVGMNVNLAPVLDVGRPGAAIREEGRSFGGTAQTVTETAIPFANTMQKAGVAATAKHFPGLGAAERNTDFAVQRVRLSKRELRTVDELPYERFVAVRGDLVMLSTAIYPAFSPKPASFARRLATRELRVRLGFHGVSISDALGTVAVRAFGGPAEAGVAAARAGTDLLLFTDYGAAAKANRALRRKLRAGRLDRERFERSVQRVLSLRHRLRIEHD
jgi:beta-N-acetylhexosaminidase